MKKIEKDEAETLGAFLVSKPKKCVRTTWER